MEPNDLALGLVWFVVFLFSDTCHEAAHAWAAKLGGDLTAFHGGQVSLNPLPHVQREPFGMVVFPILSYALNGWMMGWASAPYDPYWANRNPRKAAWMSLAGPAANFALAILACIAMHIGIATGTFQLSEEMGLTDIVQGSRGVASGLATLMSLLFSVNILLGAFNLLPIPPLDGFSVLGLFVSEDRARRLQDLEHSFSGFRLAGVLIAWKVFDPMFWPIYTASLNAVYIGHG